MVVLISCWVIEKGENWFGHLNHNPFPGFLGVYIVPREQWNLGPIGNSDVGRICTAEPKVRRQLLCSQSQSPIQRDETQGTQALQLLDRLLSQIGRTRSPGNRAGELGRE